MANPLAKIPILGAFFDDSADREREIFEQMAEEARQIDLPELREFTPDTMEARLIEEDPRLREQQSQNLLRMALLADEGLGDVDRAVFEQAQRDAAMQEKRSRDAQLQNLAARGVAGSGMELALGEAARQAATEGQRQTGLQQAAAAAQNRARLQQVYGSALGNVRQQDLARESRNVDALNRFNQMNTMARNEAQLRNLGLSQQAFQNRLAKQGLVSGAQQNLADYFGAQGAANQQTRGALGKALGAGLGAAVAPAGAALEGATIGSSIGGGIGGF